MKLFIAFTITVAIIVFSFFNSLDGISDGNGKKVNSRYEEVLND